MPKNHNLKQNGKIADFAISCSDSQEIYFIFKLRNKLTDKKSRFIFPTMQMQNKCVTDANKFTRKQNKKFDSLFGSTSQTETLDFNPKS